jgi:hypothetical protein
MSTSRRMAIAIAGLLLFAVGLVLLARRSADVPTLGDSAVIESYAWMAARGHLLLGPYSRFQWHHPGPLYFFWLAPFYALSGSRPAGLNAGALVLNLGVLAVLTIIVLRRAQSIVAVAIMSAVAVYAWRVAPLFTSAWNPHVPVLAFMALIVATADCVSGTPTTLPIVAALASLVGQTHIALLPSALAVGTIAASGVVVEARRNESRPAPSWVWLATAGVLIAVWAMPLVEQVSGHPGNISQIWTFFVSEPHRGQRFATAFHAWSAMLSGLVNPDFAIARSLRVRQRSGSWVEVVAILQLLGTMVAMAVAAKTRRGFELALASLLLLLSLVALWSTTRIEDAIFDHEVFWISGLGVLNIALLAAFAAGLIARYVPLPAATVRRASVVACWALFAVCGIIGLRDMRAAILNAASRSDASDAVALVARDLRAYFDRERITRPLVRIDQEAWPLAAGVILQLQKEGVPVAVEDDWIAMFTPEFSATGHEGVELVMNAKPQHVRSLGKPGDSVVIERDPFLFVHRIVRQ